MSQKRRGGGETRGEREDKRTVGLGKRSKTGIGRKGRDVKGRKGRERER